MKFKVIEDLKSEIVHHYDSNSQNIIKSTGNIFFVKLNDREVSFSLPIKNSFLLHFRLLRRLFRYDKSNALFNWNKDGVVIIYQKKIYFFDLNRKKLSLIDNLKQSRNALHGGIAVKSTGIFFGEYGHNPKRKPVPIWKSEDDGRSFKIVKEIYEKNIKHIHGIYADKFSDSLWIVTGDFDGECYLIESTDDNFINLNWYGDGSQKWRPVSLFFTPNNIIWVMDTPIEKVYLQSFDRLDKTITQGQDFPGPVWYSKQFDSEGGLLQTSVEIRKEANLNNAKVYFSSDLIHWNEIASFKKDKLPMTLFKYGVISFANGNQSLEDFIIFGEGLVGFDGVSLRASIEL
tara:strand:+ start:894 stop:1928 length:1035 start_codon:yes stop_codon:yes gene_type:complete